MPQIPCINAPIKRTDEVDWPGPLKKWIAASYQDDPETYAEECLTLHRLRQDMRGSGNDPTGRDLLYRYYGQLEFLDLRFPVDEAHVRVSFTWYDAFSRRSTTQHSLAYEKACVLFNLAAVLSAIGSSQVRSLQEGSASATAYRSFQAAAGLFTYINDNFLHAPTSDLHKETVKTLASLMLSQAQECMLEKSSGKSARLQHRLASWLASSYSSIADSLTEGLSSRGVFERPWPPLARAKAKYYGAMANQHAATIATNEGKYGEAVARLDLATSLAKEAVSQASFIWFINSSGGPPTLPADATTALTECTKGLHAQLSSALAAATRDNDLVYHSSVPDTATLPPLDKLCAAEIIPLSELYSGPGEGSRIIGPDLFSRLVPLAVHESASVYSEEKAKVGRSASDRVEAADTELRMALEFMRLPESLERFRGDGPGSLDHPSTTSPSTTSPSKMSLGRVSEEELLDQVKGLRQGAMDALEEAERLMDSEATEWQVQRKRWGDRWTQPASDPQTEALREDVRSHRLSLDRASQTDEALRKRWEQARKDIDLLAQGPGQALERTFLDAVKGQGSGAPAGVGPGEEPSLLDVEPGSSVWELTDRIREILTKLERVRKERADTLADLRAKLQSDDISHLLILQRKGPFLGSQQEALFSQELEKFRPFQARIAATCTRQTNLLNDCTSTFRGLMETPEAKRMTRAWDGAEKRVANLERRLHEAGEVYRAAREGTEAGVTYYCEMAESLRIGQADGSGSGELGGRIRALVKSRSDERARLIRELQGAGIGSAYALAPSPSATREGGAYPTPSFPTPQPAAPGPYAPTQPSYPAQPHHASYPHHPDPPPPPPQGYSPSQGYSAPQGGYAPPPPGPYAPQSSYPPAQPSYPPAQSSYPPAQPSYPPQGPSHPHPQAPHPPTHPSYPPPPQQQQQQRHNPPYYHSSGNLMD
ncbi:MAG: BRO1-like domain-containing protein [Piptocephalis tieghemiana]|nr:MAG: BRO1-like domain-containing protein [Piptocephalis tieghemiana]